MASRKVAQDATDASSAAASEETRQSPIYQHCQKRRCRENGGGRTPADSLTFLPIVAASKSVPIKNIIGTYNSGEGT